MGNKNVKELKALWNLEETKEFKTFVNSEIWKIINLLSKKIRKCCFLYKIERFMQGGFFQRQFKNFYNLIEVPSLY